MSGGVNTIRRDNPFPSVALNRCFNHSHLPVSHHINRPNQPHVLPRPGRHPDIPPVQTLKHCAVPDKNPVACQSLCHLLRIHAGTDIDENRVDRAFIQIEPATRERFHEIFHIPLYNSNLPLETILFHARLPQTRPDRFTKRAHIPDTLLRG